MPRATPVRLPSPRASSSPSASASSEDRADDEEGEDLHHVVEARAAEAAHLPEPELVEDVGAGEEHSADQRRHRSGGRRAGQGQLERRGALPAERRDRLHDDRRDRRAGQRPPGPPPGGVDARDRDADHHGESRPSADAEQRRVRERVPRSALEHRPAEPERGADQEAEHGARDPRLNRRLGDVDRGPRRQAAEHVSGRELPGADEQREGREDQQGEDPGHQAEDASPGAPRRRGGGRPRPGRSRCGRSRRGHRTLSAAAPNKAA
jgi:hypothetical protein